MPDLTNEQVLAALPEKHKYLWEKLIEVINKNNDEEIPMPITWTMCALRDLASLNTRVKNLEHGLGRIKEMTCFGTYGPCGQADNSAVLAEDYLDGTLP